MSTETDDRSLGRELAFKYLYSLSDGDYSSKDLESHFDDFLSTYTEPDDEHPNNSLSAHSRTLAKTILKGVLDKKADLAKAVEKHLNGRKFEKVTSLERCILLISAYELIERTETPKKVVINEAVELSKRYGEKDSYSFINGVLDSFAKEI